MPPPLSPRDLTFLSASASPHGNGGVRRGPSQRQMLEMAFEGETHEQSEHDYSDRQAALSPQSHGSRNDYEGEYYLHSLYGSTRSADSSWHELSTVLVPTTPSHDIAGPHFDDDAAIVEHDYPELFREGVMEHARRLGIDPLTEPELMWIARDSLVAQLPPGWLVQNASSTNSPYYYHTESGVSQWDHPLDEQFRLLVEEYRRRNSYGGGSDQLSSSEGLHTASYYEQHRGFGDGEVVAPAWEDEFDATGSAGRLSYGSSSDYPLDHVWRNDDQIAELYQGYEASSSATGSSSKGYEEHSDLDVAETQSSLVASGREYYARGSGAISPSHAFEIEVLKSQVEELERKNKELEDQRNHAQDRMLDEVDTLKMQVRELVANNKELEEQRSQDDALIERLEQQMKILTDEAPHQQTEVDVQPALLEKETLEAAVAELRAALDATNAEREQLRSTDGSVQRGPVGDSQVDKADLEEMLRIAREVEELRREKADEASARMKLEEVVASYRDDAVRMMEELEQQRHTNELAQKELESLQRTRSAVDEEEKLGLVREVEGLRRELLYEASIKTKLEADVAAHRELVDKIAADLDEARAVIKKLEADVLRYAKIEQEGDKDTAAANAAVAAAEQQIQTLNVQLEKLRDELQAAEADTTSLRKEIESLKLEHANALEASNTDYRLQLVARDVELEEKTIELKATKDAVRVAGEEKADFEKQLERHVEHAAMVKAESDDQQRSLKRDIRVVERDLKALQSVSKEREDEFTAAQRVIADLEQKLREQDAIVEAAKRSAFEEAEKAANEVVRQIQAEKARVAVLYSQELQTRRKLHNRLMELQGNIRVFCRVRPIQAVELKSEQSSPAVYFRDNDVESLDLVVGGELGSDGKLLNGAGQKHPFEFDHVFQPESSQNQVFEQTKALVTSALDGFNVCIFAYGQTGSGKTHTMEGSDIDPGIYYRSLKELFKIREERTAVGDFECSMKLSMLEVYNESIVDLLDTASPTGGLDQRKGLEIRIGKQGVYVENLIDVDVFNEKDVTDLMKLGKSHRSVGAHDFNEHSSRSHLVLTITIETFQKGANKRRLSKLHLIDLAGSERVSKTAASGQRLKEAQNINRSLSALGDVIAALGTNSKHVPYRNSKLTFLLQECLSGNSKVLMFVNVSPVQWNAPETLCSLNFASRCRSVALGMAKASSSSNGSADTPSASPSMSREPPSRSGNGTNSTSSIKQRPAAPSPSVKGAQRIVFG